MGNKNSKNKNINEKEKSYEKPLNEEILLNIPNPIFKKNKIIFNNVSFFEIYELHNENKIYFAFINKKENKVFIHKYNNNINIYEHLLHLNIKSHPFYIKYIYYPLNKQDYLFIATDSYLYSYLIKNENTYKLRSKIDIFEKYYFKSIKIIYNKFDNNIYFIKYDDICQILIKKLNINENKFDLKNLVSIKFNFLAHLRFVSFYENNHSKKLYLLLLERFKFQSIEINDKKSIKLIANEFSNVFQDELHSINDQSKFTDFYALWSLYNACVVYNYNKTDILCLNFNTNHKLMLIDLIKKEIITIIEFEFSTPIYDISNWNEKYIILHLKESILIFDLEINKIISKYNTYIDIIDYDFIKIKTFFSNNKKYCFLFIFDSEGNINNFINS